MTSPNTFNKYILNTIKTRGWLPAISALACLFSSTAVASLQLDNRLGGDRFQTQFTWVQHDFPGMINGCNNILLIAVILLMGMLLGVICFSHTHDKVQTDLYNSLPVTRKRQFLVDYTSGLLIFAVPYVIASLLTILVGCFYHLLTPLVLGKCLLSILSGILEFLIIYHITILAMMLTGKTVPGVLAALVLLVYTNLLDAVLVGLSSTFYTTYDGQFGSSGLLEFLSPAEWFTQAFYLSESIHFDFLILLLALLVLFAIDLHLFEIRHAEAAGNSLAFPKTSSVIKYMIAVPAALGLGLFFGSMFYDNASLWVILWSVVAVFLLCAVIEFIYQPDIRCITNRKIASVLSIGTVLVILAIFHFDLTGYDSWLPNPDKIDSIAVENYDTANFLGYTIDFEHEGYSGSDMLIGEQHRYTNWQSLYELAKQGVAHVHLDEPEEDLVYVRILFHLQSGREIVRYYQVLPEEFLTACDVLCEDTSAKEAFYPVLSKDTSSVTQIKIYTLDQFSGDLKLPAEELLEAYKKDLAKDTLMHMWNDYPIGSLSIYSEDYTAVGDIPRNSRQDYIYLGDLYFYSTYQNTLNCLKKYGYTVSTTPSSDSISGMVLETEHYAKGPAMDSASDYYTEREEITDPAEQQKLLEQAVFSTNGPLGDRSCETSRTLYVRYKDGYDERIYVLKN